MKALSIKEPWAGMILAGLKHIETRTWSTNYRGDLLLCASKKPKDTLSGYAFAIVELHNCRKMSITDEKLACCHIYDNAYSWDLRNIRPLKKLVPVKGRLGIFNIDENTEKIINSVKGENKF